MAGQPGAREVQVLHVGWETQRRWDLHAVSECTLGRNWEKYLLEKATPTNATTAIKQGKACIVLVLKGERSQVPGEVGTVCLQKGRCDSQNYICGMWW